MGFLKRWRVARLSLTIAAAASIITVIEPSPARAQNSANWLSNPVDGNFNNGANWGGGTVPSNTAFFSASNVTSIGINTSTNVSGWTFNPGASNYAFNINGPFSFLGGGIVINGGGATINVNGAGLSFGAASTADASTIFNNVQLQFVAQSTAGTASITNSGAMFFANSATAGSATITNNQVLNFNGTSDGGNAAITNSAIAVTDFSGTTGPSGTKQVSVGSIAGGGTFFLGSNVLTVGGNNQDMLVTGNISDGGSSGGVGGSLVKVGSGTMILSGVNSYSGATTVKGGVLQVDSLILSPLTTVASGGTLAGNGFVGGVQVNSGGTLAPGGATGTVLTAGSLTFQPGAQYNIGLSPSAATSTNVSFTATLGGATVQATFAPGSYVQKTYTILTAGSISGAFANQIQNVNLPANFHDTLSYDSNNVFLNLALNFGAPPPAIGLPTSGLNQNQQAVANALTGFFNANGGIPAVYAGLTPAGLTMASGEGATASQQTTFNAMSQFTGLLTDPFLRDTGCAAGVALRDRCGGNQGSATGYADEGPRGAYAMFNKAPLREQRWSVWAAGFGGSQTTDGNAVVGSNHTTSRIFGTAVGADYLFAPTTLAGFALAGGGTNFGVDTLGGGRSDLFQAGAYVHHTVGPAYITAALAYGWQDVTTDRTVTIAGIDHLRAEFNANAWSGRIEGGYRFVAPWTGGVGLTPYAAAQATTFELPAYAEQVISGGSAFALGYAAKSATDARSELGLRADKSFAQPDGVLTLRGRFAWAHDYDPQRAIAATFQALPGASFVVNGAAQARDSALTTASAEMKWLNGWSAAATFEGEFSNVTRSYAGKGVVRYAW